MEKFEDEWQTADLHFHKTRSSCAAQTIHIRLHSFQPHPCRERPLDLGACTGERDAKRLQRAAIEVRPVAGEGGHDIGRCVRDVAPPHHLAVEPQRVALPREIRRLVERQEEVVDAPLAAGLEKLVIRTVAESGECLIRRRLRRPEDTDAAGRRAIVAAVRARGLPVAYLEFDGEQHGFRRAENIVRAIKAGIPVSEAIISVGTEVSDPVGEEFRHIADKLRIGILLEDASDTIIGGPHHSAGNFEDNVISGNNSHGILIRNATATNNKIVGNRIGNEPTESFDVSNFGAGIEIHNSNGNIIGTAASGEQNTITGNGSNAATVAGSPKKRVRSSK